MISITYKYSYPVSKNKIPNKETLPVGMKKMKDLGLFNVMFEIDLGNSVWDFESYSIEKFIQLLKVGDLCIINDLSNIMHHTLNRRKYHYCENMQMHWTLTLTDQRETEMFNRRV